MAHHFYTMQYDDSGGLDSPSAYSMGGELMQRSCCDLFCHLAQFQQQPADFCHFVGSP